MFCFIWQRVTNLPKLDMSAFEFSLHRYFMPFALICVFVDNLPLLVTNAQKIIQK